jgi:hypothetical protein
MRQTNNPCLLIGSITSVLGYFCQKSVTGFHHEEMINDKMINDKSLSFFPGSLSGALQIKTTSNRLAREKQTGAY